MKIGVIGASGYSGGELLRLLLNHPHFELEYVAAGSHAGELITSVHPNLTPLSGRRFEATDTARALDCELVFFALPHGQSASLISQLPAHIRIVDLGADYRLTDSDQWKKYYGGSYAGAWTYGLPEIKGFRSEIIGSTRVANPGCYATAIALSVAPAIDAHLIDPSDIVVVAASGTTGAGRSAKVSLLGSEVMNSLTSYKFGGVHQHTPEIEQTLNRISGSETTISFTPILAPMPRGILATVTAKFTERDQLASALNSISRNAYSKYFEGETFVSLLEAGQMPKTASVLGSNSVHMQIAVDEHSNRLIVSTVIDNLGKGAAGQALQNANLMCGFPETLGLLQIGTP
jgi:N-acetyl-gamma-glutamyl-phosphate reductase